MSRHVQVGLLCVSLAACSRPADIVIRGGMVWTGLSSGAAKPGVVAIAAGKILAVGGSAPHARYGGSRTQAIHPHGGLVIPGPADGHTHVFSRGVQLASDDRPRLESAREVR